MKQILATPSAGKRLIAKALLTHAIVRNVLKNGKLVIVAGTTNGYVAQEILETQGYRDFSRGHFFPGTVLPPNQPTTPEGRLNDETSSQEMS